MSGTLALSAALAAMDRDALSALVRQRRPQSLATVVDPIGLAAELLRPESVERAIASRDRDDLRALLDPADAGEARVAALSALGLLGLDEGFPVALPEVAVAVASGLERVGLTVASLTDRGEPGADSDPDSSAQGSPAADTSSWYVAALTAVGAGAEVLRAVLAQPARMNRSGSVAVAAVKVLAQTTHIDVERVGCTLHTLISAGLVVPDGADAVLVRSSRAPEWLALPAPERWVCLAEAAVTEMPVQLRAILDADSGASSADLAGALAALPARYPLLPSALTEAVTRFTETAAHLGLAVGGWLSAPALAILAGTAGTATDAEAARTPALASPGPSTLAALELARAEMPAPVTGVYIQPDLSVVVPGPLAPADEASLAALSQPEQVGIASTRRVTEASLSAALERGMSVDEARAAFERLSVTGVPQPLDYMLGSLAERIRSIQVAEHHGTEGRTRITVTRDDLRETLLVDRALHHLQLQRGVSPQVLHSRLRADHVFAALGDARYAATLQAEGDGSRPLPDPPVIDHELPAGLIALVDRVHAAARSEPGGSGFTRRLELAIRDRSTITVTASAQGQTRVFILLPTSLDAGRLRATDARAGVERTLPVSMITAVE